MVLNLDPKFKPFNDDEIQFESFTFSGGEPHIKINPDFDPSLNIVVTTRIKSFNDLGLLCLAVDALKRLNAHRLELFIPYFPSARQDRVMVKGEALSVKVYADIINSLNFDKVSVFDPHSDVTPALLRNCEIVSNHRFIQETIQSIAEEVVLISPDGGALKKVFKLTEYLGGVDVVECSKTRDVKNGKLTGFKVYADDLEGKACLIVDDICDGGLTFIGLAQELKKKNAGNLYLAVSHGIFSAGFEQLSKAFRCIFTTNSFRDIEHQSITQIQLNHGLLS